MGLSAHAVFVSSSISDIKDSFRLIALEASSDKDKIKLRSIPDFDLDDDSWPDEKGSEIDFEWGEHNEPREAQHQSEKAEEAVNGNIEDEFISIEALTSGQITDLLEDEPKSIGEFRLINL